MGLLKTSILLLILAIVCRHVYRLGKKMGYHKMVYSHSPGACHLVPGMVNGSEDIQRLSNGLAIISSGLKQSLAHSSREGAIFLFDFNNPNEGVTRLLFTGVTLHSPHGLDVWEEPDNDDVTVFVTDHPSERDCVHKFKFDKRRRTLTYMKTIIDKAFISLNGIVPTGPDSFYATNSFGSRTSTMNEAIYIFHIMPDNKLKLKQEFMLYNSPDNIQVDKETGDMWIGAIPMMHQVVPHLEDPELPATSQVLHLKMKEGNVESMEEVFADDGKRLFIASVAVPHKNALLIGTPFHKLMYCRLQYRD